MNFKQFLSENYHRVTQYKYNQGLNKATFLELLSKKDASDFMYDNQGKYQSVLFVNNRGQIVVYDDVNGEWEVSFKDNLKDSEVIFNRKPDVDFDINESLNVRVKINKEASDHPDGKYYVSKYRNITNEIFPKYDKHNKRLEFTVWTTSSRGMTPPKVFARKDNLWYDVNTMKDASKYLNDLFHILQREFEGEEFF